MATTTGLGIIKGALRRINSYQSGETISVPDANDCLETLNDLLDSWSTDELYVYGSNEWILQWVPNKNQYTVGDPLCTEIGEKPFIGSLLINTNTITGITNMPPDLKVGSRLIDSAGVIPTGTKVEAIGVGTVTMTANATATPSTGPAQITYSIPGDFAIPRPLRITSGYTRVNALDFWLDCQTTQDQYNSILYKAQPGPWPVVAWYNNAFPYGILNVYQTPGQGGELHLFTDTILANMTLDQTLIMPQGYARAIKWLLAKELCAEYGYPLSTAITRQADEAIKFIKALNSNPAPVARYDRALITGNRPDAGWILTGGYGR